MSGRLWRFCTLRMQLRSAGAAGKTKSNDGSNHIKMPNQPIFLTYRAMVAILLASSVLFSGAQSAPPQQPRPGQAAAPAQPVAAATRPAPAWQGSRLRGLSPRAEMYYEGAWGVGELHVKVAESGQLIRFDYRVLDPAKAAVLNDKKMEPELFDAQAGVKLSVPQMEKVGKLRQQSTPIAGMNYWMAFSNPTLAVRRGHRVDVVIGSFHATNLEVE